MHIPTIVRAGENPADLAGPRPPQPGVRLQAIAAPLVNHVVGGTLLSIVTLGIYRFWYRTVLRRYYWGNTRLGDDAFEYTGTGKELFIGFLIAIAIVIPLYLLVTLIGLFGGQIFGPVFASLIGTVVMPVVIQILVYRARRYRLVRTRYRGLRFHQTGSGTGYLLRTLKWLVLTVLTLGIVYPYLRRALERYKIENTWYGSAQGSFHARVKPLMTFWLVIWGVLAGTIAASIALPFVIGAGRASAALGLGALVAVMLLALFVLWLAYTAREFRTFVNGTRIGEIALTSDLSTRRVIWVWLAYYAMMLGLGVLASAAIGGISYLVVGGDSSATFQTFFSDSAGVMLVYGGFFLLMVLGAIVTELYLRRRIWALRVRSIAVFNLAALETVIQTAGADSLGIGEAFDSGFDIAG